MGKRLGMLSCTTGGLDPVIPHARGSVEACLDIAVLRMMISPFGASALGGASHPSPDTPLGPG